MTGCFVRRARALFRPGYCHCETARLDAAITGFDASADRTTRAALDLVDQAETGGSPEMSPAERIELLTDEVIEKMRRRQH